MHNLNHFIYMHFVSAVTCESSVRAQLEVTASSNPQLSRGALMGEGGTWRPESSDVKPSLGFRLLREPDKLCEMVSFSMDLINVARIDTEIQYRESMEMMFNPPEGIVSEIVISDSYSLFMTAFKDM